MFYDYNQDANSVHTISDKKLEKNESKSNEKRKSFTYKMRKKYVNYL